MADRGALSEVGFPVLPVKGEGGGACWGLQAFCARAGGVGGAFSARGVEATRFPCTARLACRGEDSGVCSGVLGAGVVGETLGGVLTATAAFRVDLGRGEGKGFERRGGGPSGGVPPPTPAWCFFYFSACSGKKVTSLWKDDSC